SHPRMVPEPIEGPPSFLTLGAWEAEGVPFEIAGRRNLDSRVVVPFFRGPGGELHAGLLHRERASRSLRGEPLMGVEPIGFDFKGVDETADILAYGEAMFGCRTQLRLDPEGLQIPLPSYARSIGYLTELSLPLLAPVLRPESLELPVAWDGANHRIVFHPAREALELLERPGAPPHAEDLSFLLRALAPPQRREWRGEAALPAEQIWSNDQIAAFVRRPAERGQFRRLREPAGADLRFLELSRLASWETVTPATG